ncbi:hypothetical protein JCM19046_2668 [Bacillus sp. JCM 19046]|nr:hypothetical protein JCM19045_827 [Bacillus sp. JCM 19045]GAF18114.1 hypothetical protein JCM19046_2668 [Bacillus sp. JCM 19046]
MKSLFFPLATFFLVYDGIQLFSRSESSMTYVYLVIGIAFLIVGMNHKPVKGQ